MNEAGPSDSAPPPASSKPRESQHKACDNCKRRKVRCSGFNPCWHCQRNKVRCLYSSTHGRVTALERRLRQSEQRVQLLETTWKHFVPHIELVDAVRAVELDIAQDQMPKANSPSTAFEHQEENVAENLHTADQDLEAVGNLDWDETAEMGLLTDGIGSLSADNREFGYTGPQSGNALLRFLRSAGKLLADEDLRLNYTSPAAIYDSVNELTSESDSPAFRPCCIDWYFLHFHKAYPILHEALFRAEVSGAVPKPKDGSWPLLYNMVLAIGAFAGPETHRGFDGYFFVQAQAAFSIDLLQRGSLHLVQAYALMANYLQKRNKINSGFTFLGIALNTALGLGMHREFSEKFMSPFNMEIRRRVWWTIFIFDSGARLTFGRPSVTLYGANIKPPTNLDDCDLAVDAEIPKEPRLYPVCTSSLIWQARLAEISNIANAKLIERCLPPAAQMLSLDDKVLSWKNDLPAYFKEPTEHAWFEVPRMILLWRSQHLRIVMMRPFLLDVLRNRRGIDISQTDGTVSRCVSAAQDCTQSINNFCVNCNQYSGALAWYATYWLVTAAFVIVTCLVYDPYHSSATTWRTGVEQSKLTLETLSKFEPIASRAVYFLTKLMDLVPQSPDMTVAHSNETIRMDFTDMWSGSQLHEAFLLEDFSAQNNSFFQYD